MIDHRLVAFVGQLGALLDQPREPVVTPRGFDARIAALIPVENVLKLAVAAKDAPFDGPMDDRLAFALASVQRHEGIADVVREDTGRIDRFAPGLPAEGIDRGAIPAAGRGDRPAPAIFRHVQHVIREILELHIGGQAARAILGVVVEKQVAPALGIGRAQMAQGVESQPRVCAAASGGEDDLEQKRQPTSPLGAEFVRAPVGRAGAE